MTKELDFRAHYQCDWCNSVASIAVEHDNVKKHPLPPGWGVILFTVRPADPDVEEWSKHKYHACSRNCATELLVKYYPRKSDFVVQAA